MALQRGAGTSVIASALKAAPVGLIDRQGQPPSAYMGSAIPGWLVNVTWASAQPSQGGPVSVPALDAALAAATAWNASNPSAPVFVDLRLTAGIDAPAWVKSLGGNPISVTDPASAASGTVGRFWLPDSEAAYAALQEQLAAEYDANPLLRAVQIDGCGLVYDEPMIRYLGDAADAAALSAAGFTTAQDQQCQVSEIIAHQAWHQTRSLLAFNPYQDLAANAVDEPYTEHLMGLCRQILGDRCILSNQSIRTPQLASTGYASMYAALKVAGQPLEFQTAQLTKVGDLQQTIQWAIGEGATAVELPAGFSTVLSATQATADSQALATGVLPSPTPSPSASPSPSPSLSPSPSASPTPSPSPSPGTAPHVLVIMEENKGFSLTLGACSADPYLCSLASSYASASSWWGVSHPSEPNYVAIASGGIQGCVSDTSCAADSLSQTDLGGQLTAKGIPWVGWMESMPSPCFTGAGASGYALKHNPFAFFKDNFGGTCRDLPYPGISSALSTLDGANAPDFVWITPNLTDDMHDGTVQQGDAWLKANLAPILASSWFTNFNSTVIVTMDEGDGSANGGSCCGGAGAGGHIPMVIISSTAKGKGSMALTGDHYGWLRSAEEAFGLALLGSASGPSNGDLLSLFG